MDLSQLVPDFADVFLDAGRLLTLRLDPELGFSEGVLLPTALSGREALNEGFRYEVECLSPDAHLACEAWLGHGAGVGVLLPDGSRRWVCGLITGARQAGSDGGFGRYVLTLEPAAALLAHRWDARVFEDGSVPEIVVAVLEGLRADPGVARAFEVRNELRGVYPLRSYCLQYRESDLFFLERLLREEGIRTRYEHDGQGAVPRHVLVLFDDETGLPQRGAVRYHRQDASEEEDGLSGWDEAHAVRSGVSSLSTYEYKAVAVHGSEAGGGLGRALEARLEAYEPQTLHYGDPEALARYAALRQAAQDAVARRFVGAGSVRALTVGEHFTLVEHPVWDGARFLVTGIELRARSNLEAARAPLYEARYEALPEGLAPVPEYGARHAKPTARGPQVAVVVGPEGEEVHTDALGRIRIRFPWQRDAQASTWVRVAYPSAGAGFGHQFIPRVGQEVLVDFLEGDIDRPVVVGVLYNGRHPPPRFSQAGNLPGNRALSGIRTREHGGVGTSELLFDDTPGKLRARLSTDEAASELNLGHLVHPRKDGEAAPRGEGFELRTDAQGAIRAARGLLLSTEAQAGAAGRSLAREGLLAGLEGALALAQDLSRLSDTHRADPTDTEAQEALLDDLRRWEAGSPTEPEAPGGGAAAVAVSAPAGFALSTPKAATLEAGSLELVARGQAQHSAAKSFRVRAKEAISLFAHRLGMKLIAAAGPVRIEAHSDRIEITAAKKIVLTALEGIELKAPRILQLAQQASLELGPGGIVSKTTGAHIRHAAKHSLTGAAGSGLAPLELPETFQRVDFSERLDWTGLPTPWLTVGGPWQTVAQTAKGATFVLDASERQPETRAVVSREGEAVRYVVKVKQDWSVEEYLDQPLVRGEDDRA